MQPSAAALGYLIVAAFLALVTTAVAGLFPGAPWIRWVGFSIALGYVHLLIPLKVRTQATRVVVGYRPFDPGDPELPDGVMESVLTTTAKLQRLGFVARGYFQRPTNALGVGAYLAIFENPKTLEVARLHLIHSPFTSSTSLSFITRFGDGKEMAHSSSRVPSAWPRAEYQLGMTFPDLDPLDADRLYAVHRARVAEHPSLAVAQMPRSDEDVPAWLQRESESDWRRPIEAGYYWLDDERGVYRPTWKGAYLMSWKLLWPIKPVRSWLRRARAARELRRLGLA